MDNEDDVPGDPTHDAPHEHGHSAPASRETDVDARSAPSGTAHVVYDPLPLTRADTKRQQRAQRRVARLKSAPPWVKKVPWLISWPYMLMRHYDPDYEAHEAQWVEQQRKNYDR
jgi:hypothetical protein